MTLQNWLEIHLFSDYTNLKKNQISDEDAKAIADNSYAYYIFPKDQEELRDKVDEELKELKKDGTLSKLSQKYFGQDTAPEDDQFEKTPN